MANLHFTLPKSERRKKKAPRKFNLVNTYGVFSMCLILYQTFLGKEYKNDSRLWFIFLKSKSQGKLAPKQWSLGVSVPKSCCPATPSLLYSFPSSLPSTSLLSDYVVWGPSRELRFKTSGVPWVKSDIALHPLREGKETLKKEQVSPESQMPGLISKRTYM